MRHVAVFARWPRAGTVKTRLHPVLGPALAGALHEHMLRDALAAAAGAQADARHVWWANAPADAPREFPGTADGHAPFEHHDQAGPDLGARLGRAFATMLAHAADRAVVIGADAPLLRPANVDRAFEALERDEVAIAPSADGGYSLIALARPRAGLFRNVSWGTSRVGAETAERAAALGLTIARLDPVDDVDDAGSLLRFLGIAARTSNGAEHTRRGLRDMGLLP